MSCFTLIGDVDESAEIVDGFPRNTQALDTKGFQVDFAISDAAFERATIPSLVVMHGERCQEDDKEHDGKYNQ